MVHDASDGHGGSVSARVSSNDHTGVGDGASDSAVSHRDGPAVVVDPTTAKMRVGRRAQRDLVRELTRAGDGSSDDARLEVDGG